MKNQFGYLIFEAFRGFRSDRFLSVTSIITIGICTSVFAALLLAMAFLWSAGSQGADEGTVRVFLKSEYEDENSLNTVENRLHNLVGVDSVFFVSKDDALMEFRRDFGEEMLRSLDINPLPHSFRVTLSPDRRTAAQVRSLCDRVRLFPEVEEATSQTLYLAWMDDWKMPVQAGSALLLLFITGALALIIHNAVKLNLYARRTLVENMKYCGAAEYFIVTPFLLEGLLLGLGGSLVGIATLGGLIYLSHFISPLIAAQVDFGICAGALLFATASITSISSVRSVRQFLLGHV